MPCFNSAKFFSRSLESVLTQTYKPVEIIAIDDGSTDGTKDILKSHSPYVKIFCHPGNVNLGIGTSMNKGLLEAKGDLIAFLDHDDMWHPTKLCEQVQIFEEHPDVGFVYTNVCVVDENDKELFTVYPYDFRELNKPEELLLKCYIRTASSVMVRRELFKIVGLFRNDILPADHDMWLRIMEKTKVSYLPKCLTFHRKLRTQVTATRRVWEDGYFVLKEACRRYPYTWNVKRRRLAVLHYRVGRYDFNHRRYPTAMRHVLLAALYDPLRALKILISN